VIIEDGDGIHAIRIDKPPGAARGHTGETPANIVAAAQFGLFGDEQAQEGAAYVAETDDCQVIGRNGFLQELISREAKFLPRRE
jgi:hypothetical protein